MRSSTFRAALLSLLPMLFASGCALSSETIRIGYAEPAGVARVPGAERIRVRLHIVDLRTDQSLVVARKINGFGMQMASISNEEPVTDVLGRAVAAELGARGYVVAADGNVPVALDLIVFAHEFRTGFFAGKSQATVTFAATVRDAAGRALFRETITGPFEHSIQIAGGANVQKAYEGALTAAAGKLVASEAFQRALAAGTGPSVM
jgi:uncharacterized lipoprotein YajG